MRFLNPLGIGAVCAEPERTLGLLDAVLIVPLFVAPASEAEHLTGQERP